MVKKKPYHKEAFSQEQISLKTSIKRIRKEQGYNMAEFARAIGISRKQLEDLESTRTTYGCYVSWDAACNCADVFGVTLDNLRGYHELS